jgi:hypothetical protein
VTHQLVVCDDDVNRLEEKMNSINTEAVIDASKKVGVGVKSERSKYILMSSDQNAGQNHNIKITNRSFEM